MFSLINASLNSKKSPNFLGDIKQSLSRKESRDLVYRIAHGISHLESKVANPDHSKRQLCVAIYLPRDVDYLASIFACWMTGHYYIPLNRAWPTEHVNRLVKSAKPDIIIGTTDDDLEFDVIAIESLRDSPLPNQETIISWEKFSNVAGLAYIIFTSGSTGEQKGVMIEKTAIQAYIKWTKSAFAEFSENKAILQNGEMNFDISLADIGTALALDLELHISPAPRNFLAHAKMIKERKIDTFYGVPTTISNLFSWLMTRSDVDLSALRLIFSGGDVLTPGHVKIVKEACRNAAFYNMYGPTEFTVNCLYARVDNIRRRGGAVENIPTGKILEHLSYKIVSENGSTDSSNEGELVVSGVQMMLGYLNDNLRTDASRINILGKVYYRTGDIFREEGGYLYYCGRIDSLEKVKGYRINAVSISSTIAAMDNIKEAITVVCRNGDGEKHIVAVVQTVSKPSERLAEEVLSFCKSQLPSYMVPGIVIEMKSFPAGINGKVDRKKLQEIATERIL